MPKPESPSTPDPPGRGFPNHDANGVDLSLIRENLRLTPLERARKAERLRQSVLRLHSLVGIKSHPESP